MAETLSKDKGQIAHMFDEIAPKYDFLNHFMSFNIDKPWRKRLIAYVKRSGAQRVLDLACGTGDVSRGLNKQGMSVVGMDISEGMLEIAKRKSEETQIEYLVGAADDIPFDDCLFDAVTISFGIRNFDHRDKCIDETYRVIREGGMLAILEFTIPKNVIWRSIYTLYFKFVVPVIGGIVSKKRYAYSYLPKSAFEFPQREEFCDELSKGGFKNVNYISLSGGIACIYLAKK